MMELDVSNKLTFHNFEGKPKQLCHKIINHVSAKFRLLRKKTVGPIALVEKTGFFCRETVRTVC